MRVGLPLMKNVLATLIKKVFISLRLMAAASATDAVTQKIWIRQASLGLGKNNCIDDPTLRIERHHENS